MAAAVIGVVLDPDADVEDPIDCLLMFKSSSSESTVSVSTSSSSSARPYFFTGEMFVLLLAVCLGLANCSDDAVGLLFRSSSLVAGPLLLLVFVVCALSFELWRCGLLLVLD
jgi:hypothetical protein